MDDADRSRDEPSDPEDTPQSGDTAGSTGTERSDRGDSPEADGRTRDGEAVDDGESDNRDRSVDPDTPEDDASDADDPDGTDAADTDDSEEVDEGTQSLGDGGAPAAVEDPEAFAETEAVTDDEPFEGIEGPESDEEMPLAAHIEEMMRRLAVVFLFGGLATLVVVTESTTMINYFWGYHIPAPLENRPRLYGPLELPLTRLKVAGIAGVVVGLPAFVYETYRFMKPGLYERERRYYLAAVPTSLVLGGIGIAFAHFLVLPAIFSYFTTYTSDAATIAFGLAETFNLIVIMLAFMAIVFQIPLFIMLAIMMNLVTRQWLENKRLLFWGAFLGIAFLFSPDPTGMAPIIVTLTMITLFEGTLAILRWTGN
ncbi:MAG: Sec-independent protein secretion pathway component TatC [uncultured archaeon A07HR67]|nr:MAG: Sec-independent protein secretion pathway component TatC [uncultured archaeon A07HR67]